MHQVVVAHLAAARQGTHKAKNRGQVSGGGAKPYKQKGTGRARAGFAGSPIWRGGAKAFPSSPDENFSHKINRKMYRAGMASILSQLVREGRLAVVDGFTVDAPKTKLLDQKMDGLTAIDRELLGLLSDHAATALVSADLHSRTERKLRTVESFIDLLTTQDERTSS